MLRSLIVVLAATFFLAGCATYGNQSRLRMEALPQHYAQFDAELGWQTRVEGNRTFIDGVVKNVRYAYMNDLEIWVAALDPKGRLLARSVTFVIPMQLPQDQTAQFGLKLPVAVEPGDRLHFTYKYTADEGGDRGPFGLDSTMPWVQSFDAAVPAR